MTPDKELDALVECLGSMIAHRPRVLALRDIEILEQTSDAISGLRKERDAYAQRLGEAEARIETDAKIEAALTQERGELQAELESHVWEISPAMAQAKIDQLTKERDRLREALEAAHDQIDCNTGDIVLNSERRQIKGLIRAALAPQEPTT